MMVKRKTIRDHVSNQEEIFSIIMHYDMCLNPKKCIFEETLGKFLGYLVSSRGIEVDPEKIVTFINTRSPWCLKEVQ